MPQSIFAGLEPVQPTPTKSIFAGLEPVSPAPTGGRGAGPGPGPAPAGQRTLSDLVTGEPPEPEVPWYSRPLTTIFSQGADYLKEKLEPTPLGAAINVAGAIAVPRYAAPEWAPKTPFEGVQAVGRFADQSTAPLDLALIAGTGGAGRFARIAAKTLDAATDARAAAMAMRGGRAGQGVQIAKTMAEANQLAVKAERARKAGTLFKGLERAGGAGMLVRGTENIVDQPTAGGKFLGLVEAVAGGFITAGTVRAALRAMPAGRRTFTVGNTTVEATPEAAAKLIKDGTIRLDDLPNALQAEIRALDDPNWVTPRAREMARIEQEINEAVPLEQLPPVSEVPTRPRSTPPTPLAAAEAPARAARATTEATGLPPVGTSGGVRPPFQMELDPEKWPRWPTKKEASVLGTTEEVPLEGVIFTQDRVDGAQVDRIIRGEATQRPGSASLPLVVRKSDGSLWAIDGQHRLTAAKLQGAETMKVRVFDEAELTPRPSSFAKVPPEKKIPGLVKDEPVAAPAEAPAPAAKQSLLNEPVAPAAPAAASAAEQRGAQVQDILQGKPLRTPEEKLAAMRETHLTAPKLPPDPRSAGQRVRDAADAMRKAFTNKRLEVERFMERGGASPLMESAETNPVKMMDLAEGGARGQMTSMADRFREVVREAQNAGLENELLDLLNINRLEHAAEALSRKGNLEAAEEAVRAGVRALGREPKQPLLAGLPEEAAATLREPQQQELIEGALEPGAAPQPKVATANLKTTKPEGRFTNAAADRTPGQTVTVRAGTPRVDRFDMVPHKEVPKAEPPVPKVEAGADVVEGAEEVITTGDRAVDELAGATQKRLFDMAKERQPKQQMLPDMPTEWERQTINDIIDRTHLGTVRTTTEKAKVRAWTETEIQDLADDVGVPFEHAKAFVRKAEEKGGLPDWYVRSALNSARQQGRWSLGTTGDRLAAGELLPEDLTPDDISALRRGWEGKTDITPEQKGLVEALAQRVFQLNEEVLTLYRDSGMASKEVTAELLSRARNARKTETGGYSPLTRVLDDVVEHMRQNGIEVTEQHLLYELGGDARAARHPVEASLDKAAIAIQESWRNRAMQTLVDLRKRGGYFSENIKPLEGSAEAPKGFTRVYVFENGERKAYAIPDIVAEAVKSDVANSAGMGMATLRAAARLFKTGTTTANLAFAAPNVARDVSDMAIFTGQNRITGIADPRLWMKWGRAWVDVIRKHPDYYDMLDSGAAFSTFQKNLTSMHRYFRAKTLTRMQPSEIAYETLRSPVTFAEKVNNTLEEATKLAAHREFKKMGLTAEEAAWRTRRFGGSPDYARGGKAINLNTWVPFLNAQIQGFSRVVTYARQNPKGLLTAMAAGQIKLAGLQMYNTSYRDPDGTRSWDRITDREKQDNFIFFVPGVTFEDSETGVERQFYVKIPVGHTINMLRAPIQALLDSRTRNWTDVANSVLQALPTSPQIYRDKALVESLLYSGISSANPLVRVTAEQLMNRDTFRDVPIVSRRLEGVLPEQQYTERTSPFATLFAQTIGASPQRVEHAIRGTGGGLADMGLGMLDQVVDAFGGTPKTYRPRKPVTDIPGLKQVAEAPVIGPVVSAVGRRFIGGPRSVDALHQDRKELFFNALTQSQRLRQTYVSLLNDGNEKALKRLEADPQKMRLILLAGDLNKLSQLAAAMRKAGDGKGEYALFKEIEGLLRPPQ